jgi:hypothetical protein
MIVCRVSFLYLFCEARGKCVVFDAHWGLTLSLSALCDSDPRSLELRHSQSSAVREDTKYTGRKRRAFIH